MVFAFAGLSTITKFSCIIAMCSLLGRKSNKKLFSIPYYIAKNSIFLIILELAALML
jgi:hypothetical protein